MKKISPPKKSTNNLIIGFIVSVVISSCGGGSSLPKNDIVGNVPSISAEYHDAIAKLEAEGEKTLEKLKDNTNENAWMKAMKEYKEKEDAIEKKKDLAIDKEKDALKGKELPVVNENPNVEVKNLKLDKINETYATFKGVAHIKVPIQNSLLNSQFLGKDGNPIQEANAILSFNKVWANDKIPEGEHTVTIKLEIKNKPESAKLAQIKILP